MPRPNKLGVKTKTLNVLFPMDTLETIKYHAHQESRKISKQVSCSDLIRDAVDQYLERNYGDEGIYHPRHRAKEFPAR